MTTPLSPDAQKVWAAFNDAYETQGPLEDMGQPIAAALRAAVAATQMRQELADDGECWICEADELLAIAAELGTDS